MLLISLVLAQTAMAQMARKPSFYENKKQQASAQSIYIAPKGSTPVKTKKSSSPKITGQKDFDLFARVYQIGTPFEIPHILFVIDRKDKDKIYFINTPKYQLHETFIQALLNKNLPRAEINKNYDRTDRRFIFGTLSWQNTIDGYTYEFWEGDKITPELLSITENKVNKGFFAPVQFKTNSTWHEAVARQGKINHTTQEALLKEQSFMSLNTGTATGRLLLIESDQDLEQASEQDILLLKEVPIAIPPVAGVITEKPSTLLSHVNLLTKGWGIPNIYLKDAEKILAPLLNQTVALSVQSNNYTVTVALKYAQNPGKIPTKPLVLPRPNIQDNRLKTLGQLKAKDSVYCGAKAANLGEIKNGLKDVSVPDGFCIPFAQYHQFMQQHGLNNLLQQMEAQPEFQNNSSARRKALEHLRQTIVSWSIDTKVSESWLKQWQSQLNGKGVFVRSSSNSEDLPGFSGAGLYTTIPNVTTAAALEEAVKRSWASVFNFEAYEARRVAKMPHDSVMMSVFVQTAIDADSSGVLITRDPFDATHYQTSYMVAKRGIGIRVVEGRRIAEQIMYSHFSQAIQILSRSDEQTALQLDENGGVREVPLNQERVVLTDDLVVRLAKEGEKIKRLFHSQDQDIEWAIKDKQIIILQARPYIQR